MFMLAFRLLFRPVHLENRESSDINILLSNEEGARRPVYFCVLFYSALLTTTMEGVLLFFYPAMLAWRAWRLKAVALGRTRGDVRQGRRRRPADGTACAYVAVVEQLSAAALDSPQSLFLHRCFLLLRPERGHPLNAHERLLRYLRARALGRRHSGDDRTVRSNDSSLWALTSTTRTLAGATAVHRAHATRGRA